MENVNARFVNRKFKGWNSEHEFIELSSNIYILDNGYRKDNKPFVKSDSNGNTDSYDDELGPNPKRRCYMVTRLMVPDYGNEEKYMSADVAGDFKHFFDMSYRELLSYMREFNFERNQESIAAVNFHEIQNII